MTRGDIVVVILIALLVTVYVAIMQRMYRGCAPVIIAEVLHLGDCPRP
jgi:hypothetical protein